jgi:predicted NBD/HSP70 family sugar kinase
MGYKTIGLFVNPKIVPPLDKKFIPAALWNRAFLKAAHFSGEEMSVIIGLERNKNTYSVFKTSVLPLEHKMSSVNLFYIERLVKTLLWIWGGYKLSITAPDQIKDFIKNVYSSKGKRAFDANFMSKIYEESFLVNTTVNSENVPSKEESIALGGHTNGCRIGFDLGASDRKVSAVIDGKVVFSEEVPWNPGEQSDPEYHSCEIKLMLRRAAEHLPRVDAIGGSSAGIYINNRVMAASLFRGIPQELFETRVKNIFLDIQKEWNVPMKVINDGEVTALAGSMSLKANAVLGIAMGSSEAGGYVNQNGNITTQLNELAFVPIDFNQQSPIDLWSNDYGCGVQYFSQEAVIRLAEKAGIILDKRQTAAERLKFVQELMSKGDERAKKIFETIGVYLGYAIAHYADFYDLEHVLILGRVTSGEGGHIILQKANQVLEEEFNRLFNKISIHLPDESDRRVGQSIAAASLPVLKNE